jgi:hypothetical protein
MADYQRKLFRFLYKGLNLAAPVDVVSPEQAVIATNVRQYSVGEIRQRPGLSAINAAAIADLFVHTVKRLNIDEPGAARTFTRLLGAGTALYADNTAHNAFSGIATGFGGNPLSIVDAQPPQAVQSYAYIADDTKQVKVAADTLAVSGWGIAPPNNPPQITFASPAFTVISDFKNTETWTQSGTAAAPTFADRVNTTINRRLYDSGSTGWLSVEPTTFTPDIQPGMFMNLGAGPERVLVTEVFAPISNTTVAAIAYDSGTSGPCSVALTLPPAHRDRLKVNASILIDSEMCRVIDIATGPDDTVSVRTSTTTTHTAGETVTGLRTFRCYAAGTFVAGNAVQADMLQSTITAGVGFLDRTVTVDASTAGGRPLNDDDEMHISLNIDDLTQLTEVKIILDYDPASADFEHNALFKSLAPDDFAPIVTNALTIEEARQARIQRKLKAALERDDAAAIARLQRKLARIQRRIEQLGGDPNTPFNDVSVLGLSQWTELRFKIGELQSGKIGGDVSRSLRDITAIRISVTCTGTVVLSADAWWSGGGYGPDVGDVGADYRYCARYRSSTTGARSSWGPPNRTGLLAHRQAIAVTVAASSDSQVDTVDIARIGGALTEFREVGHVNANGGTLTDNQPDAYVQTALLIRFNDRQPFPTVDLPRTGVVNIAGTTITRVSGASFNTRWGRGSIIYLNGVLHRLYNSPTSTSHAELDENAGSQAGVTWTMPQPELLAQPEPVAWGPYGGGGAGAFIFACGDPYLPNWLFWTRGNAPDVASDENRLAITSPSEPLIAGCMYQGNAYVFSSERLFAIRAAFDRPEQFEALEVPNGKGLFARWFLCVGPVIYFGNRDGIYETAGGEPRSITDDLYPLFPHDGQVGQVVNGYNPPDFSFPAELRLEYYDEYLYFKYRDTGGARRVLVRNTTRQCWDSVDDYTPDVGVVYGETGRGVHSLLLGGVDGKLYQSTGTADGATAISSQFRTPSVDYGEDRAKKLFGDATTDLFTNSQNVGLIVGYDNHSAVQANQNLNNAVRRPEIVVLVDGSGNSGRLARNIDFDYQWTEPGVRLYAWEAAFVPKPEDTVTRTTDPDDLGDPRAKFLQGVIIEADTYAANKTVIVQYDAGTNSAFIDGPTITLNHDGQVAAPYSFDPFSFTPTLIGHLFRIRTTDSDPWRLHKITWIWEPESELTDFWTTQQSSFDMQGYLHLGWLQMALLSTSTTNLVVNVDGVDKSALTILSTGGLRLKQYIRVPVYKGKQFIFKLSPATPGNKFRVYQKDIEVAAKQWDSGGPYAIMKPFGGPSREYGGARI